MKTVLLIGAGEGLGQMVVECFMELPPDEYQIVLGDLDPPKLETLARKSGGRPRQVNARERESLRNALAGVDVVVVTLKQPAPLIQEVCTEAGIPSLDVAVFGEHVRKVRALPSIASGSPSLLLAGFFPGLSGILVNEVIGGFDNVDRVDLSLIQNTNARVGLTGIRDMLHILTRPVPDLRGSGAIRGFSQKRRVKIPGEAWLPVRRIDHYEEHMLKEKWPEVTFSSWTGWNRPTFSAMLSLLNRVGLLSWLAGSRGNLLELALRHRPDRGEETWLMVEASGKQDGRVTKRGLALRAPSDYGTAARVAVGLIPHLLRYPGRGVLFPFEVVTMEAILPALGDKLRLERWERVVKDCERPWRAARDCRFVNHGTMVK